MTEVPGTKVSALIIDDIDEVISEHRRHLSALRPKVKKLEWRKQHIEQPIISITAKSPFGLFKVQGRTGFYTTLDDKIISDDVFATIDEAKSIAQFHLEILVFGCLEK